MSISVGVQIVAGLALFSAIFIPLEKLFPLRNQPWHRPGRALDMIYFILNCGLGNASSAISLSAALLIRNAVAFKENGWIAGQPAWLQVLEIILIADFMSYMFHRCLHAHPILWRFHAIHHCSSQMDWLASARQHPIEKLFGDLVQFTPILVLGFGDSPILIYTVFLGLQTTLNHANVKTRLGPLRWLLAGPAFHHWHHSNQPTAYNKNFGQHLMLFDLIFGTAHLPDENIWPEVYGTTDKLPDTLWEQMKYPFSHK